jgi:hypothetical protein
MTVSRLMRMNRFWALAGMACLSTLALTVNLGGGLPAQAATTPGFDDQASLFKIFYDCHPVQNPCLGHAQVSDVASPSEDGDALEINYESGNPSYMGAYAYIKLGTDDAATRYQINYDFYVTNKTPIQALEFPMNNYIQNTRYQWAMQWEQIGSGAPQWRLWNGTAWQAIGVPDSNINVGTWYHLTIDGDIVNGKVHYMDFIIHGVTHSLTQYSFSPTSGAGDGLIAAMQVDGDSHADPYKVYLDNAHFYWK